jgi:hypothetical protein
VFYAPEASLDGTAQVPFQELRLIDASDGVEKSLLEMIGGGPPASRADLRFGTDDNNEIYLVTKQDGSIRLIDVPACNDTPECVDGVVSVFDISIQLEIVGKRHTRAAAIVNIIDESAATVSNATVHGRWSSLVDQNQTDVTDAAGNAEFRSRKVSKSAVGEFVFTVSDVVIAGYVYDSAANVETSACINTNGDLCGAGPGEPTVVYISDITVTLTKKGKNWSGGATVTVLDSGDAPASNAIVSGLWTHEPAGGGSSDLNQVVGNSDANGQFITTSSKVRASTDDGFHFSVTDVSRGSDTYDPDASVRDSAAFVP